MSGENHPHYGKRDSSHPNFGKIRTTEMRAKLSGENNHGFEKKQSFQTRLKKEERIIRVRNLHGRSLTLLEHDTQLAASLTKSWHKSST